MLWGSAASFLNDIRGANQRERRREYSKIGQVNGPGYHQQMCVLLILIVPSTTLACHSLTDLEDSSCGFPALTIGSQGLA